MAPRRALRLSNTGSTMSRCTVSLPDHTRATLPSLPPGFDKEFMLDPNAALETSVRVDCSQGSLTIPVQ